MKTNWNITVGEIEEKLQTMKIGRSSGSGNIVIIINVYLIRTITISYIKNTIYLHVLLNIS